MQSPEENVCFFWDQAYLPIHVMRKGKHPATWEDFLRGILTKRPDKLNEHKTVIERLLSESDKVITARDIIEMNKRENNSKSEFFYLHQISFLL